MALIGPEIVGLARVSVTQGLTALENVGTYQFVNGFDAVSVKGSRAGAPTVFVDNPGVVLLFLSEPVAPGSLLTQGGFKVRADVVAVSTPSSPTPVFPNVSLRWFYGNYDLSGFSSLYANVDPEKVIVIEAFAPGTTDLFAGDFVFDIVAIRDPMTEFVTKKFVG